MAERSSSTVPIIVAVIGVLGTIMAAAITNWDKLFGERDANHARSEQSSDIGRGTQATKPAPIAERKDIGMDAAAPINLGGKWTDAAGYEYIFEPGSGFSFKRYKNGEQVGWGEGSLTGRSFTYVDRGADFGDCRGEVSVDVNEMNGICAVGPNQFPIKLVRRTTVSL